MIAITIAIFSFFLGVSNAKRLNCTELLAEFNLPSEEYEVTTSDGYILTIFRVPSPGKTPVVVMPGFITSSNTWVIGDEEQNLVASLAKEGYDIWLLNYRGSFYGKKHVELDPQADAAKFWDYSFHEVGTLDLPALLDFVLSKTGFEKVFYVGHSMGGLSFYVMCVERPDYCNKIQVAGLLAPVIFPPGTVTSPAMIAAIHLANGFASSARRLGIHEAFSNEEELGQAMERTCKMPLIGKAICNLSVDLPFRGTSSDVDQEKLPKYIIKSMSGISIKMAEHLSQLMLSRRGVPKFNYGRSMNRQKYNSARAPVYKGRVSAPIIVFHSTSDPFTDQKAVNQLKKVANVVYDKLITDRRFNHMNFLFSNRAKEYVNDELIKLFNTIAVL